MGAVEGPVGGKDLDMIGKAQAEGQMLMHLRPLVEGSPHAADSRGTRNFLRRAEAADYFSGLLADWEMIHYTVDRFIVGADGREIVMVGSCAWRHKASGREIDMPKIDVHSFNEAGKVVRFQEVYDTLGFARALGIA